MNALQQELETAYEERESDLEDGVERAIGSGIIGGILSRNPLVGLRTAAGWILIEDWIADRNYPKQWVTPPIGSMPVILNVLQAPITH